MKLKNVLIVVKDIERIVLRSKLQSFFWKCWCS